MALLDPSRRSVHDLNAIVAHVGERLVPLVGKAITLVVRRARDVGDVAVEPEQIVQLVLHLAIQACEAMPDGGTLTIETGSITFDEPTALEHHTAQGEFATLRVTDTGSGMTAAMRARVFEPSHSHPPTSASGLGLAALHDVVREAGGCITVASLIGRGAMFTTYLPKVRMEAPGTPPERVS